MDLDYEQQAKRRRCKLEDDQSAGGIESLPRDIVLDILSRLPITSLVQFKFVCQAWRALAQDADLISMHLSRTSQENPCLIFHCDYPIRNELCFLDISAHNSEKERVKKIHVPFRNVMPEYDVVGSCNGLLCLSDSLLGDAVYIYNPFTRHYVELPKSTQYEDQEVVFGFGFHPVTKEYKVVKVAYYNNRNVHNNGFRRFRRHSFQHSEVQILTLGSPTWRSKGKISHQLDRCPSEALINGKLHWVTYQRRLHGNRFIVSFDLEDEEFRLVPKPDQRGFNRCNYHLLAIGGCLSAAVYYSYGKLEIWVMKDYGVKESWIKEFNIGAYMPKEVKQDVCRPIRIWKNAHSGRVVRAVCLLQNGEILLQYRSRALVCYDPSNGKFRDLTFDGMPKWFQTVLHAGSLSWINTPINM